MVGTQQICTVKGGIVHSVRTTEGVIHEEQYTEMYYQLMRDSYRKNQKRWQEVLEREEVILACYCTPDSFCHRYLLKDMMIKCCGEYVGEIKTIADLELG